MNKTIKNKNNTIELIKTVFYAIIIALLIRTFAFQPFNIPSGSMIPSLLVGDYLFVSKYSYGYSRYSFPFSLPLIGERVLYEQPERGDVIVFRSPVEKKIDYIKRVVGLPGDTVQVKNGILRINGKTVRRERIGEMIAFDRLNRPETLVHYKETFPEGHEHSIGEKSDFYRSDHTAAIVVPEEHFFVMGDNRDRSSDSRRGWFVPKKNIIGKAQVLFFSFDKSKAKIWEIWKWPFAIRYDRLFMKIR